MEGVGLLEGGGRTLFLVFTSQPKDLSEHLEGFRRTLHTISRLLQRISETDRVVIQKHSCVVFLLKNAEVNRLEGSCWRIVTETWLLLTTAKDQ